MAMQIQIVGLLLRVAWLATILPILIASFPFPPLSPLYNLLLVYAGRGKTIHSSSPLSKLTVPQRFFSHFYVLGVLWTSLLLLSTWGYAQQSDSQVAEHNNSVWKSVLLLLLMEIQVLRRLYESLCVFRYSSTARMHVIGYFIGIYFYTVAPLSLCYKFAPEILTFVVDLLSEFIVKGKKRIMPSADDLQWVDEYLRPLLSLGWCQLVGAVIFFWGSFHQRRCHLILGNLRKEKRNAPDYKIPRGDWFEYASSAHYLAEMVIYVGLVVASGGLDVTVSNLTFAAAETQRWYHQKFDDYPSNRYVVIPFVY